LHHFNQLSLKIIIEPQVMIMPNKLVIS